MDIEVIDHGTIVLVQPATDDARAWLEEVTAGQWFGGALVVEPRYVADLLAGAADEGFAVGA